MHTYIHDDIKIHYNSDFSGDLIIMKDSDAPEVCYSVETDALINFVLREFVIPRILEKKENELLELLTGC